MICYAVIDTNVLVSALISNHTDAATVQLVGRLISGEIVRTCQKIEKPHSISARLS